MQVYTIYDFEEIAIFLILAKLARLIHQKGELHQVIYKVNMGGGGVIHV